MKIDFSKNITIRGMNVQFEQGKDATLGEACRIALVSPTEEKLPIDKILERGRLALLLVEGGEIDVSPENLALVRRTLPNAFPSPEVVVTIYDLLDPKANAPTSA